MSYNPDHSTKKVGLILIPNNESLISNCSRSSTPVKEGHINKCLFNQNLEEDVTPDLTTTPLDTLPGNSKEYSRNNKRKGIKTNKNTAVEESDSGDSPDNCQDDTENIKVRYLK